MAKVERFGVSIDDDILAKFDDLIRQQGYSSRSEAIRDLMRREFVRSEWANPEAEVVGTITVAYEHHEHDLANTLTELQHRRHQCIVCSTHIHLDAHNCLEVIVVKGKSSELREIANSLISAKGVKHGEFVCTTTGSDIS